MPDTTVADAPTHQAVPRLVWISIGMMLLQVPVGLVNALFFQPIEVGYFGLVLMLVAVSVGLGLIALLAFGYGWVRHVCVAGAVLGLPRLILTLGQQFHSSPWNGIW